MSPSPAWAALFDWDGVILDSAAAHERSWEELSAESGYELPEDHFNKSFGMRNLNIIPELFAWTQDAEEIQRLSDRKEELYRMILKRDGIDCLPGVRSYLQSLNEHGIPAVIGTSTTRDNVELLLDLMDLRPFFQDCVSAEDVRNGKPNPEVFLKAASLSGLPPASCVVFEDAHHGIEAAIAAGIPAVGVLTTHPGAKLKGASILVKQLDELPLDGSHPLQK